MKNYALLVVLIASAMPLPADKTLVPVAPDLICGTNLFTSYIGAPVQSALKVGVALGIAEVGSRQGVEPEILVGHLKLAKREAQESAIGPLKGIDVLIEEMEATKDSRTVHASVIKFREGVEEQIRRAYPKPLPPPPHPDPVSGINTIKCAESDWAGEWTTSYGKMKLRVVGDGRVVGWYGSEVKTLDGAVDPDDPGVYTGKWRYTNSGTVGTFQFRMVAKGEFHGGWTSADVAPSTVGVNWSGTKVKVVPVPIHRHDEDPAPDLEPREAAPTPFHPSAIPSTAPPSAPPQKQIPSIYSNLQDKRTLGE
jgi:hypothetical protein